MFVLYAIPLGLALCYVTGGRLDRLASLRFRWGWLALAGLLVQVVLFSPAAAGLVPPAMTTVVYVLSTAAVLGAVVRNAGLPGIVIIVVGATANLAAVIANGGVMPTTDAALGLAGLSDAPDVANSAVLPDPVFPLLTDIFALPAWVPLANVFSVGDVLIGVGVVVLLARGMQAPPARDVAAA